MNPKSHVQARAQIRMIMEKKISGRSPKTKKEVLRMYENIAEQIWRRWQAGPHRLQLKHLQWYLCSHIADLSPGTQYRHWMRVEDIIIVLGKHDHWEPRLRGSWRHPQGLPHKASRRGRKSKFRQN